MPYALIPIGLAALLAYGFTFLISHAGLISPIRHRQLWNTALLLTFFTTAVLGIILAVQVNYKLEIPWIKHLFKKQQMRLSRNASHLLMPSPANGIAAKWLASM